MEFYCLNNISIRLSHVSLVTALKPIRGNYGEFSAIMKNDREVTVSGEYSRVRDERDKFIEALGNEGVNP